MSAPIPKDESERLAALHGYRILDTLPEEVYNRIVSVAAAIYDTPIALFSIVDADRQWFKARIGFSAQETPREISFCAHVVATNQELLVDDTVKDPRFVNNALVVGKPHIRFYYGVPVRSEHGQPLGALCVIDQVPRTLTDKQRVMLGELAREVEAQLALRRTIDDLQLIQEERAIMSSMIAHDANNLMTRVVLGLDTLRTELKGDDFATLTQVRASVEQMLRMCGNFVELNKDKIQPALATRCAPVDLVTWFQGIVHQEIPRAGRESLILDTHVALDQAVHNTDAELLERIVLNLLDNAYREAPKGSTVRLELTDTKKKGFELTVENQGRGVPEDIRSLIFEPFFSAHPGGGTGTGLGLAFCRLAAQALGGHIEQENLAQGGSRFRVEIPG